MLGKSHSMQPVSYVVYLRRGKQKPGFSRRERSSNNHGKQKGEGCNTQWHTHVQLDAIDTIDVKRMLRMHQSIMGLMEISAQCAGVRLSAKLTEYRFQWLSLLDVW
jgi:hypothetical protein